jgi:co-chaperonin GroES (HSP10)
MPNHNPAHDIIDHLTKKDLVKSDKVLDFSPMNGFVHVEKVEIKDLKTTGGILIPGNLDPKAAVFRVLGVGPGELCPGTGQRMPVSTSSGDLVLADVTRIINLSYCGQDVLVVEEAGIFGKVTFIKDTARS